MNCWFCGKKLVWQSDENLSDIYKGQEGVKTVLCCSNEDCGAIFEGIVNDNMRTKKYRKVPIKLDQQLKWAKSTMVNESFINIKTQNKYFVKDIVVDTETMELRVIYTDGHSNNDWDRPLTLFIQKFTKDLKKGNTHYEQ